MSYENVADRIHAMLVKYVAFPDSHAAVVATLWIFHTWVVEAFFTTPRFILNSPEPGSGKTRLLELLALLCRDARIVMNTSAAALYRRIGAAAATPTILADECDMIFHKNAGSEAQALAAIYNSGYRRGATVDRCEGDASKMQVTPFKVFAAAALAGLGNCFPRAVRTRGIIVPMRKRARGEKVSPFRERDALEEAQPILEHVREWAAANFDTLEKARPEMPKGVVDRPSELWEPLIAVADTLGGRWPKMAREACVHYVFAKNSDSTSIGVHLLAALHELFNPKDGAPLDAMHSADIITELTTDLDSPWRDLWGQPLDQRKLSTYLKSYGVKPKQIRIGSKSQKGYLVAPHEAPDGDSVGLADAWERYLPPASPAPQPPPPPPVGETRETSETLQVEDPEFVSDESSVSDTNETSDLSETKSKPLSCSVSDVSDVSPTGDRGAENPPSEPALFTLTGFTPPSGPGRCGTCGHHVATQNHRPDCTTQQTSQEPVTEAETLSMFDIPTLTYH